MSNHTKWFWLKVFFASAALLALKANTDDSNDLKKHIMVKNQNKSTDLKKSTYGKNQNSVDITSIIFQRTELMRTYNQ